MVSHKELEPQPPGWGSFLSGPTSVAPMWGKRKSHPKVTLSFFCSTSTATNWEREISLSLFYELLSVVFVHPFGRLCVFFIRVGEE